MASSHMELMTKFSSLLSFKLCILVSFPVFFFWYLTNGNDIMFNRPFSFCLFDFCVAVAGDETTGGNEEGPDSQESDDGGKEIGNYNSIS